MKSRPIYPLRKKFDELGLTTTDISRALGLSIQHVSKVLNGNASAIPEAMVEFLKELDVDVRSLENECSRWREDFKRILIESYKGRDHESSN